MMSKLMTDVSRVYELGVTNELPVASHTTIYEGAVVGDNGQNGAKPLVGGDVFRGFADRYVDNSTGEQGEKTIRIRRKGTIVLPLEGVTIMDLGKAVYATLDNSFTLSPENATFIGYIIRLEIPNQVVIDFDVNLNTLVHNITA